MTVIEFGTKDLRLHTLYIALGILVIGSVFLSISMYSRVSSLRHDMDTLREEIGKEEVRNADFKNRFYQQIQGTDPEAYLSEQGYVFDKKPAYEQGTAVSKAE
jgi:hypothetical protein